MTKLLRAAFAALVLALAAAPITTVPGTVSASGFTAAAVRIAYSPTLTAQNAGTGLSLTANDAYYVKEGPFITVRFDVTVTAAGSGNSGSVLISTPTAAPPVSGVTYFGSGFGSEEASLGVALSVRPWPFSATIMVAPYNAANGIVTGYRYVGFFRYLAG